MNSKTYVFSDSVLCLGGISPEPVQAWKDKIKWYLETCYLKELDRIGGEQMEFEWTNFPRRRQLSFALWCCLPWEDRGTADCGTGKTRERNNVQNLIETNVFWEPWAHGSLDGRRREGSDSFTTRGSQWSADKAGVTSALRLQDATNAFLSMKHDVDKQAANQMALKDADKVFFDQRISLAVVTITRN